MIRRPPRSTLFPYTTLFRSFQMRGKFRVDFVLRFSIKGEAGEALADKFLPISHAQPSSLDCRVSRIYRPLHEKLDRQSPSKKACPANHHPFDDAAAKTSHPD